MIAAEFRQFIESFANMLSAAGAITQAKTWRALLPIFEAEPSLTVKDICKVTRKVRLSAVADDPGVNEVVTSIQLFKRCLGENAKKVLINDLTDFEQALAPFAGVAIVGFVDATAMMLKQPAAAAPNVPHGDLVKSYLGDLERAVGDDAKFPEVFGNLKLDPAMKAPQVKQLAKIFAGASEKTKGAALDRILARHESLIGAGARAKATGGRTAA